MIDSACVSCYQTKERLPNCPAQAVSFVDRAKELLGGSIDPSGQPQTPGSRGDFIQAVALLGNRQLFGNHQLVSSQQPAEPATGAKGSSLVSLPYEMWVHVFGEPIGGCDYSHASVHGSYQSWKHLCVDGPLHCIGRLSDRKHQDRWVVLARVRFV